jgi:hypothetical protein
MGTDIRLRHCVGRAAQGVAFVVAALFTSVTPAVAQSAIGNAVIAMWNSSSGNVGNVQTMNGRLFGAIVFAQVVDGDNNTSNLSDRDQVVAFEIRDRRGNPIIGFPSAQLGTSRAAFTAWVTAHANELVNAFFPGSLSGAVSGIDATSNNAQQILQGAILDIPTSAEAGRRRTSEAGGLFEVEHYSGDARDGSGFQALIRLPRQVTVLTRYVQETQNTSPITVPVTPTSSRSINVEGDYHPSIVLNDQYEWRVGADAHGGIFVARATTIDFGTVDAGGGAWTSARKDFARVRIAGGAMFGGTKTHVPVGLLPDGGDAAAIADAFNSRGVQWDVTYGVVGGYALNPKASLNGKVLQTLPTDGGIAGRPNLTTFMVSVSYLVAGLTPIDIGYKHTMSGDINAHSIFFQGNFGF